MEEQIFVTFLKTFPHLQNTIQEMKMNYNQKLWHQLSEQLLNLVKDPLVLAQGKELILLYNNFVKHIENKFDQLKLVRFVTVVSDFYGNDDEKLQFLDQIIKKSITEEEAIQVCKLKKCIYQLNQGNFVDTQTCIQEISQQIDRRPNIDQLIYSTLYKVSFNFFRLKKNYEDFYKNALQFLAYTPEDELQDNEKQDLSYEMAQALLISPTIYNFSELLELHLIRSLQSSQTNGWIYKILETFNQGDVKKFQEDLLNYKHQFQNNQLLAQNLNQMEEKIRIMAFLELIFNLPKNQRTITFQQIAEKSLTSIDDVELLIMRAMSLQLIKGSIDQIEGTVDVNWIVPRVLNNQRIQVIKDKLDDWNLGLQKLYEFVQNSNIKNQQ